MPQKYPQTKANPQRKGNSLSLCDNDESCKETTSTKNKSDMDAFEVWVRGVNDMSNPDQFKIK